MSGTQIPPADPSRPAHTLPQKEPLSSDHHAVTPQHGLTKTSGAVQSVDVPRQLEDKPASTSAINMPPLLNEAHRLLAETRPLLNQTPSERHVAVTPKPKLETKPATVQSKPLSERTTTKAEEPVRGWLGMLNPLSWFGSQPQETPAAKRDVKEIDNKPGFFDSQISCRLLSFLSRSYVTGLTNYHLSSAFKQLSATYHKSLTGQPFEPEVIHLEKLVLASGTPLRDVRITLHRLDTVGPEDDPFKQIKMQVSITGKADLALDDDTVVETDVDLSNLDIDLGFNNGNMIGRLITVGGIYGNIGSMLMNWRTLIDDLQPKRVAVNIKNGSIKTALADSDKGQTSVAINSARIALERQFNEETQSEDMQAQVKDLDVRLTSHKLKPVLPKTWRQLLTDILPYSAMGKNDIHIQTEQLDYCKKGHEKRIHCPTLKLDSSGDITLKNGKIQGLTVATRFTPEVVEDEFSLEPSPIPLGPEKSQTAVGFSRLQGELLIPQSTLMSPYDIRGTIDAQKGAVYIKSTKPYEQDPGDLNVAFKVNQLQANLNGGLTLNGEVRDLNGIVDGNRNISDIHIPTLQAEHMAIGVDPDQVTEENRLLEGHGHAQGLAIRIAPGPSGHSAATIKAQHLQLKDAKGAITAQQVTLDDATLTLPESALKDTTEIRLQTGPVQLQNVDVPKSVSGKGSDIALPSVYAPSFNLAVTMASESLSDPAQIESYGATFNRPVEEWQKPVTRIKHVDVNGQSSALISAVDLSFEAQEQGEPLKIAGTLNATSPKIELQYSAEQGVEHLQTTMAKADFHAEQGDIRGDLAMSEATVVVSTSPDSDVEETKTVITAKDLHGEHLDIAAGYLPEGLHTASELQIGKASLQITTQPPELIPEDDAHPESYTARPVQTTGAVHQCRIKTDLAIAPEQTTAAAIALKDNLQTLKEYLPGEQEQLQAVIQGLENAELAEPEQQAPMHQTVEVELENTHYDAQVNKQGIHNVVVKLDQGAINLEKGPLEGETAVKNLTVQQTHESLHTSTEARLEELKSTVKTSAETTLPITLAVTEPLTANNIQFQQETFSNNTHNHVHMDKAQVTADVGLTHSADHRPMQVGAKIVNLNANVQQDDSQNLGTLAMGEARVALLKTQDQFGVKLNTVATGNGILVVSNSSTQEDQTTNEVTAELANGTLTTSGALNGIAQVGKVGVTVVSTPEEIKINPRFNANNATLDFPNGGQELVQIFQKKESLEQSALGQLIELNVTPKLDENLTGSLSISAGGVITQLLTYAIDSIENRVAKGALQFVRVLMSTLTFRLELNNLPITQGRTTFPDVIRCLGLSFSSPSPYLKPYAKLYQAVAKLLRSPLLHSAIKKAGLFQSDTGEISLTKLISQATDNVHIVPTDQMPVVQLPGSGDTLLDAANLIQVGEQLPAEWSDKQYRSALANRIKTMRWHNESLEEYSWADSAARKALCQQIMTDYPLPTTLEQFQSVEKLLADLQSALQWESEEPSLLAIYAQVQGNRPTSTTTEEPAATPQGSAPAPIGMDAPKVRMLSFDRYDKVYQNVEPQHINGCLDHIQGQLSRWLVFHMSAPVQQQNSRAIKTARSLLNSRSWKTARQLASASQGTESLSDDQKRSLWRACRRINQDIYTILNPIAKDWEIKTLDQMITPQPTIE